MIHEGEFGEGKKRNNGAQTEEFEVQGPETGNYVETSLPQQGKMLQIKVVFLGEASVGKSSFVARFLKLQRSNIEPTIGAAFFSQQILLHGNIIKYDIWDTAGQERFHSLTPMYYRNAQAIVIAYEIIKASTFDRAKNMISNILEQTNPGVLITIIGTKMDLIKDNAREVDTDTARAYAESVHASFFETSAIDGTNVNEVFFDIGTRMLKAERTTSRLGQMTVGDSHRDAAGNDPQTLSWDNYNNHRDRSSFSKKWFCCYIC